MKKDRNAFFQEAGYFNQSNISTPNMMNMTTTPFATNAQSSFYAGPIPNMNYNTPTNMNANIQPPNYDLSDIESRLSKLERQINRLDARISKIENTALYPTEEIDTTTNMYMV